MKFHREVLLVGKTPLPSMYPLFSFYIAPEDLTRKNPIDSSARDYM